MRPLRQSSVSLKAKITTQLKCGWEMFGFGKLGRLVIHKCGAGQARDAGGRKYEVPCELRHSELTLVQVMGERKGNTVNHDGPITSVEVQSL